MGTLNDEQLNNALGTLKMLLGIKDNEQDSLLSFLIDDTVNMILGYCRTDILPRPLESLVPVIAADMYRRKGYGKADAPQTIKSVTEDKRSISFESGISDTEDFLEEYEARLKPFVCRKGRVPSDIG